MPSRTNVASVKAILQTSLDDGQINAFISDASLWVTEELVPVILLSDERLELIERYLACAMVRIRDLGLKSATIQDVTETYQVDLYVSEYLQRAASFDPTGRVRKAFLVDPKKEVKIVSTHVGEGYQAQ